MTATQQTASLTDLAGKVALACRILARAGLASASLGHVSARSGDGRFVVRCRSATDAGLLFTAPGDVRETTLDDPEPDLGYALPNELPIHSQLYRRRSQVAAVVHVHAPAAVLCGLAGLELRPIFGSYDIPAARLALAGVPLFRRAALITRAELADELIDAMGPADVCLMRGHGVTVTGSSVEQATVRALNLELLARVTVDLARLGAAPDVLTENDRAELPDLGAGFNEGLVWRHHAQIDRWAHR